ncbi:ester cyclase [Pseudarthrobacter albicanus]|uniref:ester cyclase n=1 Tax=Pseudarthrobacter albicanus TaxID=2823873 RepID=UPI001BAC4384|nr:ester cyclase [Pseudarthrobacter albicanus]
MSTDELKRIDDQAMTALNNHDADAFLGMFADVFVWHDWTVPEPIRDLEGARQYFNAWMTAFPDFQEKQTDRIVGEDAVAVEVEFTGTNTGPMVMGGNEIPATNRAVTGRGTYIARIRDGKIVEYRTHPDVAGMMMQLGLMAQE